MSSLQRKNSRQIGDVIKECLRIYGIAPRINRHLIDKAWGEASGAAPFTTRTFYRNGCYYVTISSSVVRSQLLFQKDALVDKVNALLSEEALFDSSCESSGYIKNLVLK